jgi:hypothetical protein
MSVVVFGWPTPETLWKTAVPSGLIIIEFFLESFLFLKTILTSSDWEGVSFGSMITMRQHTVAYLGFEYRR